MGSSQPTTQAQTQTLGEKALRGGQARMAHTCMQITGARHVWANDAFYERGGREAKFMGCKEGKGELRTLDRQLFDAATSLPTPLSTALFAAGELHSPAYPPSSISVG